MEDPLLEQEDIKEWNALQLGGALPKAVGVEIVLMDDEGVDHAFSTTIIMPIAK